MPRDIRGRVVEPTTGDRGKPAPGGYDVHQKMTEHEKRLDGHDGQLSEHHDRMSSHHDRLKRLEDQLGIAKKADEMKSEDQGGRIGNPAVGHDTETRTATVGAARKSGPHYGRKRH